MAMMIMITSERIWAEEWNLCQGSFAPAHARAQCQADGAASILNEQADKVGDGNHDGKACLVARCTVGHSAADGRGDEVAYDVTNCWARQGADDATSASKDRKAYEAENDKQQAHEESAATAEN